MIYHTPINTQIIISSETYVLPSEIPKINLRQIIPHNYDIAGIQVDFPSNLKNIIFEMGSNTIVFDKDMTEYMKTFPFYTSLCRNTNVMVSFLYDIDWINTNIEYEMLDEYVDQDVLGENVTIWDGFEYHTGEIVLDTKKIPTGEKVYNIVKSVDIVTPQIVFDIKPANYGITSLSQKIMQKIDISDMNDEYKKQLTEQFNLTIMGNGIGYIDNTIQYSNDTARLYSTF